MLALIEGPLWYAAVALFAAGTIWRLAGMLLRGKGAVEDAPRVAGAPARGAMAAVLPRTTFYGNRKVQFVLGAGLVFHAALFIVILFGEPHVAFIRERILGVGWRPLPVWAFVLAAELAAGSLLVLWIRRSVDPVTRLISRSDDHWAAGLTMAVLLTGCFALGGESPAMRALHMLSVEAWLVYFPLGSLFHAFTWILSRGYTGAMLARRGIRT